MLQTVQSLLDNDAVNEETKKKIVDEWKTKVSEIKEEVRAELYEEFAQKFTHDKAKMVEALDVMVSSELKKEIKKVVEEKKRISHDRIRNMNDIKQFANEFDDFLKENLQKELKEFHIDLAEQKNAVSKLEKFVIHQLAEEIKDFQKDRKNIEKTKVRLVKEAHADMNNMKRNFVKNNARLVNRKVKHLLSRELNEFKEDIDRAAQNDLGQKVFDAFAPQFHQLCVNENAEVRRLENKVSVLNKKLRTLIKENEAQNHIIKKKEQNIKNVMERNQREKILRGLMKNLNEEKGSIMYELLKDVKTSELEEHFDRYFPSVLDGNAKSRINENIDDKRTAITGDKTTKQLLNNDENIVQLSKLAGI